MQSEAQLRENGREPRILVVDDNADNVEIIATRLRFRGYEVVESSHGADALLKIDRHAPDLILLDVMLPDIDGYEIARRLRNSDNTPYIPIILVTARDSTEDKITGLDAGADDYLTKPINFPELEARVRSMLRIKRLQDELEEKNRELERLSTSDGLTGLYNHRHIHGLLHEEWERANRTGERLTLAMFDLDHFKAVNDTYGHQAGDRVLEGVAELLCETAREIDRLGRYGGEEFMAVLPDTGIEDGEVFVERVRRDVARRPFHVDGQTIHMTISAGIASYPHTDAPNPRALVRCADQALYAAKAGGRDLVVRYDRIESIQAIRP